VHYVGGACGTRGREEKYIRDLVGHPEGRRLSGRSSHGWEADTKWIMKNRMGGGWPRFMWLRTAAAGRLL